MTRQDKTEVSIEMNGWLLLAVLFGIVTAIFYGAGYETAAGISLISFGVAVTLCAAQMSRKRRTRR